MIEVYATLVKTSPLGLPPFLWVKKLAGAMAQRAVGANGASPHSDHGYSLADYRLKSYSGNCYKLLSQSLKDTPTSRGTNGELLTLLAGLELIKRT